MEEVSAEDGVGDIDVLVCREGILVAEGNTPSCDCGSTIKQQLAVHVGTVMVHTVHEHNLGSRRGGQTCALDTTHRAEIAICAGFAGGGNFTI